MSPAPDMEKRNEEAIKLVSDWGKWIVTLELAVIGAIGALFASGQNASRASVLTRVLATVTVGTFLVSMAAAAIMLLTLPEIMQRRDNDENIWRSADSVLRIPTERLALTEAVFFGLGVVGGCAMIVSLVWV